jgi:predicted nucleic acid-binding protein
VIALDSSVVVASFGAWHEHHELARSVLSECPRLPAHTALEAYSVLTRLPDPFRAEPATVAEFLKQTFTTPRLVLSDDEHSGFTGRLADLGIAGGAVYDALIAFTAEAAGAELLTLDRRAMVTYQRCRTPARLLV